jgi:hypothetical protein
MIAFSAVEPRRRCCNTSSVPHQLSDVFINNVQFGDSELLSAESLMLSSMFSCMPPWRLRCSCRRVQQTGRQPQCC